MGRCEGATAEKAVPFPSDRPSIRPLFCFAAINSFIRLGRLLRCMSPVVKRTYRDVCSLSAFGEKRTSAKPHSPRWSAPGQRLGMGVGIEPAMDYDAEFKALIET